MIDVTNKTSLCSKAKFFVHGFFLFNSEGNYNAMPHTFAVKEIFHMRDCFYGRVVVGDYFFEPHVPTELI